MKADTGLKLRGGKPGPQPVGIDIPISRDIGQGRKPSVSEEIERQLCIQRVFFGERCFEGQFRNITEAELRIHLLLEFTHEPTGNHSLVSECLREYVMREEQYGQSDENEPLRGLSYHLKTSCVLAEYHRWINLPILEFWPYGIIIRAKDGW